MCIHCGKKHKKITICGHECYYGRNLCRLCYDREWKKTVDWPSTMRKHNLRAKYNLTIERYEELLNKQGGACAICGSDKAGTHGGKRGTKFGIDHDHTTGQVRGLLCGWCNTGLGGFRDNKALLMKAVEYLEIKR